MLLCVDKANPVNKQTALTQLKHYMKVIMSSTPYYFLLIFFMKKIPCKKNVDEVLVTQADCLANLLTIGDNVRKLPNDLQTGNIQLIE